MSLAVVVTIDFDEVDLSLIARHLGLDRREVRDRNRLRGVVLSAVGDRLELWRERDREAEGRP